ncbi:hypothetical protein IW261DRAFT_1421840 [Armillaria novae-zelandiae]|uniref:Uncharacterized protein n=1 Tax=Armillaria novae-zelandiae TaxID=153914 RepID=A0AA39P2M7_9AGAR|nr:hypothetical protein IW261DRAFT_1421840 [Armillaria novae-zelandiae]
MDILDDLEKTLTDFEPPSDLSPHALHGKYESIITVAKEWMAKAEEDIPPPPNQLALGIRMLFYALSLQPNSFGYRKRNPSWYWHAPISEKQSLADCVTEIILYIDVKPLGFDSFCMNIWHVKFPKYEVREQEFLIKMVKGYEVVSVEEINNNLNQCLTLIDLQLLNLAKSAAFTHLIDYTLYTAANLQYTHRKMVTGHNHLLTLYRIILLDPSVEMCTKTGTPTFSSSFAGTLDIFYASLEPFTGVLSKHDDKNQIFLVNFLCAVGTKSVYAFIKEFIESLDDQDNE